MLVGALLGLGELFKPPIRAGLRFGQGGSKSRSGRSSESHMLRRRPRAQKKARVAKGGLLKLRAIECRLVLSDLYEKVELATSPPPSGA